jgi:hypothetical protein
MVRFFLSSALAMILGLLVFLVIRWTALPNTEVRLSPRPHGLLPLPASEIPPSWSLAEIQNRARPPYPGRVHVLAWQIIEDDRPLRVEQCLVLKVLDQDDGSGRWCLSHLYRHPDDETPIWELSQVCHYKAQRQIHSKRLKQPPSNETIYASLHDVAWKFDLDAGWKSVDCRVCEKTWLAAVGEKPNRFFKK